MARDVDRDIHALGDIRQRLEAAENSGDADYLGEMMAEDAVIMVPNEPVQEGKTACAGFVRDILAHLLEHFDRRITYVSAEVRVIGDFAFDRGNFWFTVVPKSGGHTTRANGKYLWLYSYSGEGPWKLARVIVSLDEEDDDEHGGELTRWRRALARIEGWLKSRWSPRD
jgi:uncharacterized protein (TIGR02246 family)